MLRESYIVVLNVYENVLQFRFSKSLVAIAVNCNIEIKKLYEIALSVKIHISTCDSLYSIEWIY